MKLALSRKNEYIYSGEIELDDLGRTQRSLCVIAFGLRNETDVTEDVSVPDECQHSTIRDDITVTHFDDCTEDVFGAIIANRLHTPRCCYGHPSRRVNSRFTISQLSGAVSSISDRVNSGRPDEPIKFADGST